MDSLIKILIVEDEMIIGAKISMQLTALGYEVTGLVPRGEEAVLHVKVNKPDIVLLDINLKGKIDGIETAKQMYEMAHVPIIYLTANTDEATFNRAKATKPYAFISKPYKPIDLQRAIELTISRLAENEAGPKAGDEDLSAGQLFVLSDRIFVRHKESMVKIMLENVLYIEADRNYSHVYTKQKDYLLSVTLKNIEEKLPPRLFQRIHRSFVINVSHMDEVLANHVVIVGKQIPIGTGMKDVLLKIMRTL